MQLKDYQQKTLRDLEQYIDTLNKSQSLAAAFAKYWADKGADVNSIAGDIHPYVNSVEGVPRVTLKVPTAGGKTFIACHAVKRIMDSLLTDGANRVVAWFVPSDTILKQTLDKLQDPSHPYRQTLDALFAHRVTVVDKEAALMAQGISPAELHDNLTIFVLSAQSFIENVRVKSGKGTEQQKPRAFRQNGNFIGHTHYYAHPEQMIDGADSTALIQVIAQERPVVIVDESHNFRADLRVEMLKNISPRFILELTATPRENSNIISIVNAMQLKREHMVKLPVVVENRNNPNDVLVSAIRMRQSLERHAKEMERQGGRHIRPIVLFQAQPKTDDDNITFEKIKSNLVRLGIAEEQIKIKTANKDELRGVDLMSRECEVRYIITVNALKEGWDCPFAYILATLANKTSRVDVEQILGRILRQPYTANHSDALLNLSYVFTSSNDFRDTVDKIIVSLQRAGFSRKDFREAETKAPPTETSPVAQTQYLFADEEGDGINLSDKETEHLRERLADGEESADIADLQQQARQMSEDYENQMAEQTKDGEADPLADITNQNMYSVNEDYRDVIAEMNLPIFYTKTRASLFCDDEWIPLEKSMLSEGFNLPQKDSTINFNTVRPSGVTIDVAASGDGYVPVRSHNQRMLDLIREQYVDKSAEKQKEMISRQIASMIKMDDIAEPHIRSYVERVVENLDADEMSSLLSNIYATRDTVQEKINGMLKEHRKETFQQWINVGRICLKGHFTLADTITLAHEELRGIGKGLYVAEETVNDFEYAVVSAIADCPGVLFWHRNRERRDFFINGFINHYPDFIVRMKSGITVLVETKGDHLDNDDSRDKIRLGNKWADMAGQAYRYFLVFETNKVEGALTVQQFLDILREL